MGVNFSFECILIGVMLFVVDIISGVTPVEGVRLTDDILVSIDGETTLLKTILSED
jgi:hypothetical protein